jgi:hypothetical protein
MLRGSWIEVYKVWQLNRVETTRNKPWLGQRKNGDEGLGKFNSLRLDF